MDRDMVSPDNITRTGNTFSIASCEFRVVYPDECKVTLWSPPWHSMTEEEEATEALLQANLRVGHPHELDISYVTK